MALLLVTARLQAPVAAWTPLHLDGLLCAGAFGARRHLRRTDPEDAIEIPPIPIPRLDAFGTWCYLTSAWIWPEQTRRGREAFVRRKDSEDIMYRDSPWTPNAGPEKAYYMPVPTIEAPTVSWLVIGDRKGVRDALRSIRQVGILRRQGYGIVSAWSVEDAPSGTEYVHVLVGPDGRAARHLPATWTIGESEFGSYQPPYWHPARQRAIRVALGTPCVLRPEIVTALAGYR